MKLKKNIPLIDQHDKYGFWGGKFGGSFIPETLKKPVEDLTIQFEKLRNDKKFIEKRDFYFKNYIGAPTSLIKLERRRAARKEYSGSSAVKEAAVCMDNSSNSTVVAP